MMKQVNTLRIKEQTEKQANILFFFLLQFGEIVYKKFNVFFGANYITFVSKVKIYNLFKFSSFDLRQFF